jgi:hypothetical protein
MQADTAQCRKILISFWSSWKCTSKIKKHRFSQINLFKLKWKQNFLSPYFFPFCCK